MMVFQEIVSVPNPVRTEGRKEEESLSTNRKIIPLTPVHPQL